MNNMNVSKALIVFLVIFFLNSTVAAQLAVVNQLGEPASVVSQAESTAPCHETKMVDSSAVEAQSCCDTDCQMCLSSSLMSASVLPGFSLVGNEIYPEVIVSHPVSNSESIFHPPISFYS